MHLKLPLVSRTNLNVNAKQMRIQMAGRSLGRFIWPYLAMESAEFFFIIKTHLQPITRVVVVLGFAELQIARSSPSRELSCLMQSDRLYGF